MELRFMKYHSLRKVACWFTLILISSLVILTTLPKIALAQTSSALQSLDQAIDFEDKKDFTNAEFFYKNAIKEVLQSKDVEVLIVAKTRLANLPGTSSGQKKKLLEQAEAGEIALGDRASVGGTCGECNTSDGNKSCKPGASGVPGFAGDGECSGAGATLRCKRCR